MEIVKETLNNNKTIYKIPFFNCARHPSTLTPPPVALVASPLPPLNQWIHSKTNCLTTHKQATSPAAPALQELRASLSWKSPFVPHKHISTDGDFDTYVSRCCMVSIDWFPAVAQFSSLAVYKTQHVGRSASSSVWSRWYVRVHVNTQIFYPRIPRYIFFCTVLLTSYPNDWSMELQALIPSGFTRIWHGSQSRLS